MVETLPREYYKGECGGGGEFAHSLTIAPGGNSSFLGIPISEEKNKKCSNKFF